VASLLPGRRSEINIYGSADIDSWFFVAAGQGLGNRVPDQLTLTHSFSGRGRETECLVASLLPGRQSEINVYGSADID
jgi:hypothetical protein